MNDMMLKGDDAAVLRQASLFRKMRALTRAMRKGTGWRLGCEEIRHGDQCPLTFVGGYLGSSGNRAIAAATQMGLGYLATPIMCAADSQESFSDSIYPWKHRRLRRILLRAAGLKEAA
jgi:hypothetical protein